MTTVVPIRPSSKTSHTVPAPMASTLVPITEAMSRPSWVLQSPSVGSGDRVSTLKSRSTAPFTGQVNTVATGAFTSSGTTTSTGSTVSVTGSANGSGSSGWVV